MHPYEDGLIFHQLFYADEVRAFADVDTGAIFDFHDAEKSLALQLIEQLSHQAFDPAKYEDSYRSRVLAAVEQKVAGQKIQAAPEAPKAQIIDLFEALKQSLNPTATLDPSQALPPIKAAEKPKRSRKSNTA